MSELNWTDNDQRAVDLARILAADAVQKVGNGHPGTAISLAPVAYMLYQKVMALDPNDDKWIGRDRFVLSAGHASIVQYVQLYLGGLGLELDDLRSLRTFNSLTPGHPEYGHTRFVECTTGPLGAGISNAVGMAMAARRERGLYDPEAQGSSIFDHFVYTILGDGCMQEGVQAEAASLAGTQRLGNLIAIYDDNAISIEGDTKIAFGEDVSARYAAYGWDVHEVDWTDQGRGYHEDVEALYQAIMAAQQVSDKPSLIHLKTVIAWPLPTMQGKHSTHGSALGEEEISRLKDLLGFDDQPFAFDSAIVDYTRSQMAERGRKLRAAWDDGFEKWAKAHREQRSLYDRVIEGRIPDLDIPYFEPGSMATRAASGAVLTALADQMPELWGGSADLAGSNNTTMKGQMSFLPADLSTEDWTADPYRGRILHFGVREHAMGGIVNGINLSGLTRAYCGTFFVFADYMRPAVRLAALSKLPSVFVWTHDSIGVGEDGPTHQPIEHLASYRAIPGLAVVRPADANETAEAWKTILNISDQPTALVLSRQNLPIYDREAHHYGSADGVARGAYILAEANNACPEVIVIATGSEVEIALEAREILEKENIPTRVVSMPCQEWFDAQDEAYREEVLPSEILARVSVEAGLEMGWSSYTKAYGRHVGIDHFGASAKGSFLFEHYGLTAQAVVEAAHKSIASASR